MAYKFSSKSLKNLEGVHCDLVEVMHRAIKITKIDFAVVEGLRTESRQRQLVEEGFSTTLNSRHLTGHAVDIIPYHNGKASYQHWPAFYTLAEYVKQASRELQIPVDWGGDWKSFPDGPHYQLSWKTYPR